ncbi:hypothetical protein [Nitratireductor rhodophyticola]|uniref:hypothetical protein n=1 Tax=Nitratireductor rhodophyticola TaxID=2854036 RepID=UPI003BA95FEF
MSEDLIERLHLRASVNAFSTGDPLCREAKAEIERLRAKLADVKAIESSADYWAKRAEAAEKRLAEAEKVIAPFASEAKRRGLTQSEWGQSHGHGLWMAFAHLRAAAEWMEKGDE